MYNRVDGDDCPTSRGTLHKITNALVDARGVITRSRWQPRPATVTIRLPSQRSIYDFKCMRERRIYITTRGKLPILSILYISYYTQRRKARKASLVTRGLSAVFTPLVIYCWRVQCLRAINVQPSRLTWLFFLLLLFFKVPSWSGYCSFMGCVYDCRF